MKLKVNRSLLYNNLQAVARALSVKPQLPATAGIKIDVRHDYVKLTATNNDLTIQATLNRSDNVVIQEEGSALLPGRFFVDIVKKIDAEVIDIASFENTMVKIYSNQSDFTLNVLDLAAFPVLSFVERAKTHIVIDVLNFRQIVKKTVFNTDTADNALGGVHIKVADNWLTAEATDTKRIGVKKLKLDSNVPDSNIVVPAKNLEEMIRIFDEATDMLEMDITHNKILVKYKNLLVQSRLIEENYPNTDRILDKEVINSLTFNRDDLLSSIDRTSLVLDQQDNSNSITISFKDEGYAEISADGRESGYAVDKIVPIATKNTTPFMIRLNYRNLEAAIKAFDSETVDLDFSGEARIFMITGKYDVNHVQALMPIALMRRRH